MNKYLKVILGAFIVIIIRRLIVGDFHTNCVDWCIGIIWGFLSCRILGEDDRR